MISTPPIMAANADTGITYSLSGTDAALFNIDAATGKLTFKASTTVNSGTKASYAFSVTATDVAGNTDVETYTANVVAINKITASGGSVKATIAYDVITGSASADTFTWGTGLGNAKSDHVIGFTAGTDKLNVKDILSGYTNAGDINDWISFEFNGTDTKVLVDFDGAGAGARCANHYFGRAKSDDHL